MVWTVPAGGNGQAHTAAAPTLPFPAGEVVTRCASIPLMATGGIIFLCSNSYSELQRKKDRESQKITTWLRRVTARLTSSEPFSRGWRALKSNAQGIKV